MTRTQRKKIKPDSNIGLDGVLWVTGMDTQTQMPSV